MNAELKEDRVMKAAKRRSKKEKPDETADEMLTAWMDC